MLYRVLVSDINHHEIVLVESAWIVLHELALVFDREHIGEQDERSNELDINERGAHHAS